MRVTGKIALRNLFRQKRRNILLGLGIALGMSILVVAMSFTNGIKDTILNHFMKNAFGHIVIQITEKSDKTMTVVRDKEYFETLIRENVSDIEGLNANFQQFTRVVGNGTSDMLALVSQSRFGTEEFLSYWGNKVVDGEIGNFTNKSVNNPILLYDKKAETLKVKVGDTIKVKLRTIHGQVQAASLTLVATVQGANDMESMAGYIPLETMQMLAGYASNEVGSFMINLSNVSNPIQTVKVADELHKALTPQPVVIEAAVHKGGKTMVTLVGHNTNTNAQALLEKHLTVNKGSINYNKGSGVIVSASLARKLGLAVGSPLKINYVSKYAGTSPMWDLKVSAIAEFPKELEGDVVMLSMLDLYENIYDYWPRLEDGLNVLDKNSEIYSAFATPYSMLERTYTTKQVRQKQQKLGAMKFKGARVDVLSMNEVAEQILQFLGVLDMVAVILVMILFVIITVGVVNTLHMTIKERTREIGTIRAIGMQRKMVRQTFVLESTFLSFFSTIAGLIFALIIMGSLSLFEFSPKGIIAMLLRDGHTHFVPTAGIVLTSMIIIILITVIVAYFPSRKAARISAADALRHFE